MELWQQQGFESFGAWRRETERARRAAKKLACASNAVAPAPAPPPRPPSPPPRATWEPLEAIEPPAAVNSPWKMRADRLPGTLHEHVQMTPGGSRQHTFKHTSPGGTTRVQQRASPAGPQQLSSEDRFAWRQQIAAERRKAAAERAAQQEQPQDEERDVFRYLRPPRKRCGACATCLELRTFGGSKHRASAPCDTVLTRLMYTESERAVVCDPTERKSRWIREEGERLRLRQVLYSEGEEEGEEEDEEM